MIRLLSGDGNGHFLPDVFRHLFGDALEPRQNGIPGRLRAIYITLLWECQKQRRQCQCRRDRRHGGQAIALRGALSADAAGEDQNDKAKQQAE